MPTLEELEKQRKKEADKLKKINSKMEERRKKSKIKEDIRNIKAARLRGQFGFDSPEYKKTAKEMGASFKGAGRTLGKGLGALGHGIMGIGMAANEYYDVEPRKKRKVKRK